jgi:uncharacterized protein (DUF427 family)
MKAIWNGAVLAESNDTVVVEGNHYFPQETVRKDLLRPSARHSSCAWKGRASYYTLDVDGHVNDDAAWFYPDPLPGAEAVSGRIAFWHGVQVQE